MERLVQLEALDSGVLLGAVMAHEMRFSWKKGSTFFFLLFGTVATQEARYSLKKGSSFFFTRVCVGSALLGPCQEGWGLGSTKCEMKPWMWEILARCMRVGLPTAELTMMCCIALTSMPEWRNQQVPL
ncbi:unnamed protein product [Discosporangium mesarthrocarpum]